MDPALNFKIVAEDLTGYLITAEHATGQPGQWVAKSALDGSLAAQGRWESVRNDSFRLLDLYQQDPTTMDAFGSEFINIYFTLNVMHAVIEEPGSLAVWNALTAKHPGCEMVRLPTKFDRVAYQARENDLRLAAQQAISPLTACGDFDDESRQAQSSPGLPPPSFFGTESPESDDTPDAADQQCRAKCQELPFAHNNTRNVVFSCAMAEHGDQEFHTCTACSADVVKLLTTQQQDAHDFGAISSLCRACGWKDLGVDVLDDIAQRICACLAPETQCRACMLLTLNGLVECKQRAGLRTCHGAWCFDCGAVLGGGESMGRCSYCGGLEIDEPQ